MPVEMSNGTDYFRKKRNNHERLTEIFKVSFRKFSVQFDFEPEFSENLVEWNAPKVFANN